MRIGELSGQTGVPVRLLRYYEEQELLRPDRSANGYRAYAPADVQRVTQIRGLIDAGVPTAIIRDILPCLDDPCVIVPSDPAPAVIAALEQHRQMIDARIQCLSRNRDAISRYLKAIDAYPSGPL